MIIKAWNTVLREAGIEGKPGVDKLRLHDLRHTCATKLARSGDQFAVIEFLCHYRNPSFLAHSSVSLRYALVTSIFFTISL
jgi:integrase